jgi:hypothetical protein
MRFVLFLTILLTSVLCHVVTGTAETAPDYVVGFEDRESLDAYNNGDSKRLNDFFNRWELQSTEISQAEFELYPMEVKRVYELFEAFYCDHKNRMEKEKVPIMAAQAKSQNKGRESSQPKAAEKQEYLVIQNEIRFVVLSNDEYESCKMSIGFTYPGVCELRNFRPRISSRMGRKVLYLDKTYDRALNYFFNETNGDSLTCRSYDEKKEMFLSEKMSLYHHHWGRGYHYISFPQVHIVIFNSDMDKAYIPNYRDRWYGGGSLECQRQNGTWKMGKIEGGWRE